MSQPAAAPPSRSYRPPPPLDTAPLRGLAVRALLCVLLLAALAGAFFLGRSRSFEPRTAPHVELRPTASVITAVRDLARLESASYHVEKVIELTESQTRFFGLVEAKDAILLVAVGEVTAGVDLQKVRPEDITEETVPGPAAGTKQRRVRIVLPAPEVFSVALDNQQTHVFRRATDTLATRNEQLEGRARAEAEGAMRKAAAEGGLLERARANAERTIRALLDALGFDQIVIDWS